MKEQQLSLLSRTELAEISKAKPCVIFVRACFENRVSNEKILALVNLTEGQKKVKGQLFKDRFGELYVGCALIQNPKDKVLNTAIPLYRSEETLASKLEKDVNKIKLLLQEKRRYYYAN